MLRSSRWQKGQEREIQMLVVLVLNGPLVALITAGLIAIALWMYWRFRFQQQRRRIYEELPGLIDTTLRYLSAGRSLAAMQRVEILLQRRCGESLLLSFAGLVQCDS